ncbi:hypothetical protein HD554DRAFT_735208 [Boletus coccyginus]|nr:hypothetical protein HD554DRAFT_735208 [Boletus coccyginus]
MDEAETKNAASVPLNDLERKLQTIVPSAIRSGRRDAVSRPVASTLRGSQSNRSSAVDPESLPDGWMRIKHPDSGVYYANVEKRVFTSSNMLDSRTYALIMEGAGVLRKSPALQALLKDQKVDLVLDVQHATSYYCISHVERRVFWLEGIGHEEVDVPCTSNKCTQSTGSRTHCIEAQYWKHCELFQRPSRGPSVSLVI